MDTFQTRLLSLRALFVWLTIFSCVWGACGSYTTPPKERERLDASEFTEKVTLHSKKALEQAKEEKPVTSERSEPNDSAFDASVPELSAPNERKLEAISDAVIAEVKPEAENIPEQVVEVHPEKRGPQCPNKCFLGQTRQFGQCKGLGLLEFKGTGIASGTGIVTDSKDNIIHRLWVFFEGSRSGSDHA